jgi:hypothetical protein
MKAHQGGVKIGEHPEGGAAFTLFFRLDGASTTKKAPRPGPAARTWIGDIRFMLVKGLPLPDSRHARTTISDGGIFV